MKRNQTIFIGLCVIMALFSCEKDNPTNLTDNPNKVSAALLDTFQINTFSVMEDSVKSSERNNPLLGIFNSNLVGIGKSSIFGTLKPDSLDRVYPSSDFVIDSFFLELHVVDKYGNNQEMTFDVYKTLETISNDSTYYGFDSLQLGEHLGAFKTSLSDSGVYYFNLDSSKASELMNLTSTETSSNENFYNFFPGIAIIPQTSGLGSNEGAILKLNRIGIALHLWFSTTNNTNSQYDLQSKFDLESDNYIFANYEHIISGTSLEDIINDSTLGNDFFLVQGMSGGIGKIKFPTVKKWYESNPSTFINQFQFKVYTEPNNTYPNPEQLILTYMSTTGVETFTTGTLNESEGSYTFFVSPAEIGKQLEANTFGEMNFTILNPTPGSSPAFAKIYGANGVKPPELTISVTNY